VTPNNLGLCLERAGKVDAALKAYEAALEVWPDYLPAVQGLALATVRAGRDDERLAAWVDTISAHTDDDAWRSWERTRSVERSRPPR
jgi:tetratricopeptide (TPR) repeat protein